MTTGSVCLFDILSTNVHQTVSLLPARASHLFLHVLQLTAFPRTNLAPSLMLLSASSVLFCMTS